MLKHCWSLEGAWLYVHRSFHLETRGSHCRSFQTNNWGYLPNIYFSWQFPAVGRVQHQLVGRWCSWRLRQKRRSWGASCDGNWKRKHHRRYAFISFWWPLESSQEKALTHSRLHVHSRHYGLLLWAIIHYPIPHLVKSTWKVYIRPQRGEQDYAFSNRGDLLKNYWVQRCL